MRPTCETISKTLATTLITNYLPKTQDVNEKKQFGLMALLLLLLSENYDGAAANLIEENRALRHLFLNAMNIIKDDHLKERLKEAAESDETNFRMSALDKENGNNLSLLIELQSHIETVEGIDARKIEDAIWQELENYKKRREFMIWDMATSLMTSAG